MRNISSLFFCLLFILLLFNAAKSEEQPLNQPNNAPVLDTVSMNRMQIVANCSGTNLSQGSSDKQTLELTAHATDIDNDPLVYGYEVSAGQIRNAFENSSRVIWDLSGVKVGEYTVIFYADDGAGFNCNYTNCTSMSLEVVENSECRALNNQL